MPFQFLTAQPTLPEPILFPFESFDRIDRLVQDDRGFLWLGTNRGLFCFDGSSFRRIQHSADNTSPIDNGAINDLLFDPVRNRLWIASSRDIHALDLETESFVDVPYYRKAASQAEIGECLTIFQDRAGVLWFGIEGFGLIRVDTASYRFFPAAGRTRSGKWTIRSSVSKIAQDVNRDSILWLAAGPTGLVHFNTESGLYTIPDQGNIQDHDGSRLLAATLLATEEKIYLGNPWDRYGYVYDLNTGQYRKLDYTTKDGVFGALGFLADGTADAFWACNRSELLLLDRHSGDLVAHFPKPADVRTFVEWMLATPGRLWVGSDNGLLLYDFNSYRVENHLFEQDEQNRPLYLASVLEKEDGSGLWVAFHESQYLYEYDYSTRKAFQVMGQEKSTVEVAKLIRLQNGMVLALGRDGFYELRDRKLIRLPVCREHSATGVGFSTVIEDSRGQIWVSSRWGGLFKLNLETGRCEQCLDEQDRPEMRHIFRDKDDNIWVPYTGGFSVYHAERDSFYHFPYRAGSEKTVQYPRGFAQDAAGNVWISDIVVGGLMRVDPSRLEEGVQERVVANNGPWTNQMRQMATDKRGRIWAVTKAGLQVFDPETKTFELYGESAGFRLRGNNPMYSNFIPSYISRLSTGEMVVGYTNGFARFHPDSLQLNPEKPRPYFLSLKNGPDTLIGSPKLGTSEKISLPHDQNDLDIEYSTIAWRETDKIRFQYRLSGLNDQWKETSQRQLNFTNLAPGAYAFQLFAVNGAGIKAEEPLIMHFEILPPWWRTGWAYGLYVLFFATAAYAFYYYRKSQWELQARLILEQREAEQLKKLNAAKTRLYTNITHEFRTPITVILGMARQVRDKPGEWFQEGIQTIIRRGQDLLRLVNQMLDLSKLEAGSLPVHNIQGDVIPFLRYLVESFHSYAETEGVQLKFHTETDTFNLDYDPEKLMTIVTNLLSNAIKFTPAGGMVQLSVTEDPAGEGSYLKIVVKDTGIGIPAEKLPYVFDRFYQVEADSRLENGASPPPSGDQERGSFQRNDNARSETGTGIGLALTRELVRLLGGQIAVASNPGQGTTFTVSLPVSRTAPPVESQDLFHDQEGLAPMAAPEFENPDREEAGAAQDQRPLLLVIEDDRDVVRYLGACLQDDYRLEVAYNGLSGMEKARKLIPDIIVSDVMMPEADGYEVCQRLKSDRLTSHIPIVLLTAKADPTSRIEGLDCGADAYLAKPFLEEELLVRLRKLIELRNQLQEYYRQLSTAGEHNDRETAGEEDFVRQVREILEASLGDEDFDIADLCKALAMSRAQLYRKFTALTGQSIGRYFRSLRLQRAKHLLLTTSLTISEIAFESGFKDPSYFTRQFRTEFGKTPSELRR